MWWPNASNPDGSRFEFNLKQLYCDPDSYEGVHTVLFFVTAGWCPACPSHAQTIMTFVDDLYELGMMIVWVEAENDNFELASADEAEATIRRYIGDGPGIRVGDADTNPEPKQFQDNPIIQAFPTYLVVRRSDMQIFASSSEQEYGLPVLQVARHPDADWADSANNTLPTTVGEPCNQVSDCETGTLIPQCNRSHDPETGEYTGWTDGYCLAWDCATEAACGEGNICEQVNPGGLKGCFRGCETTDDCRRGYRCRPILGIQGPKACWPTN
jgi:hypothetical protein